MLGLALDGRGIFGQFEAVNTYPTNLDACGGHVGTVPTTTSTVGTSGTAQTVTFTGGSYYHCASGNAARRRHLAFVCVVTRLSPNSP